MGLRAGIGHQIRMWAKATLPDSVLDKARRSLRYFRSSRRVARLKRMPPVELNRLIEDLRTGGIGPGEVVMVHSSLWRVGNVVGGADTVIKSLLEVLTPEGTVMMPAYNSVDGVIKGMKRGRIIDLRTSSSATGKVTETFRPWPGVLRSSHPFSSVCAWGKQAEYVTDGHAQQPRVCHTHSPVGRLVELQGRVVGLGVSIKIGAVSHYLEDTWDEFPFEVHSENFPVTYIDASGSRCSRDVCRFDPKVSRTRIDRPGGKWIRERLTEHLTRKGILKRFRYGETDSWVMEVPELMEELKRLIRKGVTMYLTKDQLTGENRDIGSW